MIENRWINFVFIYCYVISVFKEVALCCSEIRSAVVATVDVSLKPEPTHPPADVHLIPSWARKIAAPLYLPSPDEDHVRPKHAGSILSLSLVN